MKLLVATIVTQLLVGRVLAAPVNDLTSSNFIASINDLSKDLWLLTYYDPECTYSKDFMPVIDDVGSLFENHMGFGTIDCRKEEDLCSEIKYYPALKWYRDGEFHDYEGAKDRDALLSFASHMTSHPVKNVGTYEDIFQEETMGNDVAFIMRPRSSSCKSNFESVARHFQYYASFVELELNKSNDEWLGGITKQKSKDVLIRMERDIESSKATIFRGDCAIESLSQFVQDNLQTLVPEMTEKNVNTLGGTDKFLALGVVDPTQEDSKTFLSNFRKWVSSAPPSVKNHFSFAWTNALEWTSILEKYEVEFTGKPEFLVVEVPHDVYWNFPKDAPLSVSMNNIGIFLKNIMSGEVVPKRVESDDDESDEMNGSMEFMPGMFREQSKYFDKHPWAAMCMFIMGLFDILFLLSMALPPEKKLARFMEKHVGSQIDKLCSMMTESDEAENAKEKKE